MSEHWELSIFSAIGSFVLYCKLKTEGKPVIEFLHHIAPTWRSPWRPFAETVLFAVIGGLVSFGLIQPTTLGQAIAAGLGWTGLVSAFSKKE